MVKLKTTHPDLPYTLGTDPSVEAHLVGSNTAICLFPSTSLYFIQGIELHAPYGPPLIVKPDIDDFLKAPIK
jgi:hypothetical protein